MEITKREIIAFLLATNIGVAIISYGDATVSRFLFAYIALVDFICVGWYIKKWRGG